MVVEYRPIFCKEAQRCDFLNRDGCESKSDFSGVSGSTLIAAQQTGRKAFLMELDALYADVIVQRFETFTGKKAERVPAEAAA